MRITTESGAIYEVVRVWGGQQKGPYLKARCLSRGVTEYTPVVAIYPDRLPYLRETQSVKFDGRKVVGFNRWGRVTIRVIPDAVGEGMILANRDGFVTTPIRRVWR